MRREKAEPNGGILYLYDVKARNKKEFNRTKRRFYYWINKMFRKDAWVTKSTILVPARYEAQMSGFFRSFKGKIKVFKAQVESIEELE